MNNNEICTRWIKCEHCKDYRRCFAKELQEEEQEEKSEKVHLMKKAFWEKEGGASEVL